MGPTLQTTARGLGALIRVESSGRQIWVPAEPKFETRGVGAGEEKLETTASWRPSTLHCRRRLALAFFFPNSKKKKKKTSRRKQKKKKQKLQLELQAAWAVPRPAVGGSWGPARLPRSVGGTAGLYNLKWKSSRNFDSPPPPTTSPCLVGQRARVPSRAPRPPHPQPAFPPWNWVGEPSAKPSTWLRTRVGGIWAEAAPGRVGIEWPEPERGKQGPGYRPASEARVLRGVLPGATPRAVGSHPTGRTRSPSLPPLQPPQRPEAEARARKPGPGARARVDRGRGVRQPPLPRGSGLGRQRVPLPGASRDHRGAAEPHSRV